MSTSSGQHAKLDPRVREDDGLTADIPNVVILANAGIQFLRKPQPPSSSDTLIAVVFVATQH
jgi:hypothetical protein